MVKKEQNRTKKGAVPVSMPKRDDGKDRLLWLAEMYRMYAASLQRSIFSKVGDPFLAEDLTSTVFLKALRWLRADQSEESVRGWLYATARTTIVDHWQSLGQYQMLPLADLENSSSSPLRVWSLSSSRLSSVYSIS